MTGIRNKGGVPFVVLHGNFVVRQRQMPDGDTVAFAVTQAFKSSLVKVPVSLDGMATVNLRLQSIDAPEKSQPMGAASRDALLKFLRFKPAGLGISKTDFSATLPAPEFRPGWIVSHGMDSKERVLAYLFVSKPPFAHGASIAAEDLVKYLKSSANYAQVSRGWAFPSFYNNTEETHAVVFQAAAAKARTALRGVWKADVTTTGFIPTKAALGADGALVYPKFYRRVEGWKNASPDATKFIAWLKTQSDGKKLVVGAQRDPVPLWKLFVKKSAQRVAVPYDVLKLWFSE